MSKSMQTAPVWGVADEPLADKSLGPPAMEAMGGKLTHFMCTNLV